MNILILEDTPSLLLSLDRHFKAQGHTVDLADTLHSAQKIWRDDPQRFDLLVLDENLPDGLGSQLLAEVRADNSDVSILVLTARSQVNDVVHLLDVGADDYMTKPFEFPELDARVRALHRRRLSKPAGLVRYGRMEYDAAQNLFWAAGQQVPLRQRELQLLIALLEAGGNVCSKAKLLTKLYNLDEATTENAVEVHMGRLRKRIEGLGVQIETVRGLGYRARCE